MEGNGRQATHKEPGLRSGEVAGTSGLALAGKDLEQALHSGNGIRDTVWGVCLESEVTTVSIGNEGPHDAWPVGAITRSEQALALELHIGDAADGE